MYPVGSAGANHDRTSTSDDRIGYLWTWVGVAPKVRPVGSQYRRGRVGSLAEVRRVVSPGAFVTHFVVAPPVAPSGPA